MGDPFGHFQWRKTNWRLESLQRFSRDPVLRYCRSYFVKAQIRKLKNEGHPDFQEGWPMPTEPSDLNIPEGGGYHEFISAGAEAVEEEEREYPFDDLYERLAAYPQIKLNLTAICTNADLELIHPIILYCAGTRITRTADYVYERADSFKAVWGRLTEEETDVCMMLFLGFADLFKLADHMLAKSRGEDFEELPDILEWGDYLSRDVESFFDTRSVAARMYWIQQRIRGSQKVYVDTNRYAPPMYNDFILSIDLAEEYRHYLPSEYIYHENYEWSLFLILVTLTTEVRTSFTSNTLRLINHLKTIPGYSVPRVAAFTRPATDAEVLASGEKNCPICLFSWGTVYSDALETEPPVWTRCRHLIGKVCCERLREQGMCPHCRRYLWDLDETLPREVATHWRVIVRVLDDIAALDKWVDEELLRPGIANHGPDFYRLLWQLHGLARRYAFAEIQMFKAIPAAIEEEDDEDDVDEDDDEDEDAVGVFKVPGSDEDDEGDDEDEDGDNGGYRVQEGFGLPW
ncbi:hypothetical protein CC80DRAFT_542827 [Byssothecium circinans]|uniref:RING-type domain-containing protein n=1 Tax=Byssothecium circinans TaxID=147558 RepID=A0A6A5UCA0_9PLEO|nr:hypothetical protein CC80DRAFT_542827 [Byssothecium circinans]